MHTIHDINDPKTQGLIVLLAGIVIRFIIGQRIFNRRGVGGLQHFNHNYLIVLIIQFTEWIFKWIANGLIIWGLLKLFIA